MIGLIELVDRVTSRKFKVEVIADSTGNWCSNGLRYVTREAAEYAARDLFSRWTAVREWRVVEVPDAKA